MLSDFYTSKDWVDFIKALKLTRLNDNGDLICQHCLKPIIRKYDAIGHHIIELTEDNYLDSYISLSPDNVIFLHHKCHNIVHDKLGIARGKKVYVVYGSPLSGKSTYVNECKCKGDLIVDIDSIWQCLSGCDRYIKPNRIKQNVFIVRNALIDMVKTRQGMWNNAYIIGGYPLISERERLIKSLGAEPIFIDVSKDECMKRLHEQNERDIDEWEKYICDWFEKYSPHHEN